MEWEVNYFIDKLNGIKIKMLYYFLWWMKFLNNFLWCWGLNLGEYLWEWGGE
jgi:hypothetical protein